MADDGALRVRGHGAALREKPMEGLSNGQRIRTLHHRSFPGPGRSPALRNENLERSSPLQGELGGSSSHDITTSSSIDDLEESLRQLKVQVHSLASSLSFDPDPECTLGPEPASDSSPLSSRWPAPPAGSYEESGVGGAPKPLGESEWFMKPKHLLHPLGDYSALTSLGLPTFARSPMNRVAGLLGSEIAACSTLPSVDLSSPLKLGAPHVIGVKALLPPTIPVRPCLPGCSSPPLDRGRSLSLDRPGAARSRSFSPASKRARWLRSRSQSPRPVWRPTSAKADACSQPLPQLAKPRATKKRTASSRPSRSRIYRLGTLAARSQTPTWAARRGNLSDSWSPYGLASGAISSPTAQELNERFLRTLAEGALGSSLIEMSPYQQELARLRLERLRVEEAWLLELKRQQELERTRGPQPKW
ncbi:hypothetical protein lerEdw1_019737 [Lerista edwardsae]|nr:hypothetical protein lerEdw1_019737 [Lerista edwardsae]